MLIFSYSKRFLCNSWRLLSELVPASSAYDESNVIWVRDSDSVRDRVKVTVTSVVLVTARVRPMFRDVIFIFIFIFQI